MDKAKKLIQMVNTMMANGLKTKWMVMEKCKAKMEVHMKEVIGKIWDMDKELQLMQEEIHTKVSGKLIKEMGKENIYGKQVNIMKGIGKIIKIMDLEKCNMLMEVFMKVIGKIIWDTDKEVRQIKMDNVYNRENGKMIKLRNELFKFVCKKF